MTPYVIATLGKVERPLKAMLPSTGKTMLKTHAGTRPEDRLIVPSVVPALVGVVSPEDGGTERRYRACGQETPIRARSKSSGALRVTRALRTSDTTYRVGLQTF